MENTHCKVVVLISGNGSNLQALIDQSADLDYNIVAVISNKADAFGLQRAAQAGIETAVVNHKDFSSREEFDLALMQAIDRFQPDLLVLAGFMRILGTDFVAHYAGRTLNIHPSLLPKYPGINTHQRALDAGDTEHGVSVHFVTEELDGGPVIAQEQVPVKPDDTAESLAARVLEKEHVIYPQVVSWFASNRLKLEDNKAVLDGQPIGSHGVEQS
ncbi:MAG: phosphoribosylglycinamide formyltransferase [Gammaproteobacteria bacterium]